MMKSNHNTVNHSLKQSGSMLLSVMSALLLLAAVWGWFQSFSHRSTLETTQKLNRQIEERLQQKADEHYVLLDKYQSQLEKSRNLQVSLDACVKEKTAREQQYQKKVGTLESLVHELQTKQQKTLQSCRQGFEQQIKQLNDTIGQLNEQKQQLQQRLELEQENNTRVKQLELELQQKNQQLSSLHNQLKELQQHRDELQEQVQQFEAQIQEQTQNQKLQAASRLTQLETQYQLKMQQKEQQIAALKQSLEAARESGEKNARAYQQLVQEQQLQQQQIQQQQQRIDELTEENTSLKQELQNKDKITRQMMQEKVDKDVLEQYQQQIATLRDKQKIILDKLKFSEKDLSQKNRQIDHLQYVIKEKSEQNTRLQEELGSKTKALQQCQLRVTKLKQENQNNQSKLLASEKAFADFKQQLAAEQAKKASSQKNNQLQQQKKLQQMQQQLEQLKARVKQFIEEKSALQELLQKKQLQAQLDQVDLNSEIKQLQAQLEKKEYRIQQYKLQKLELENQLSETTEQLQQCHKQNTALDKDLGKAQAGNRHLRQELKRTERQLQKEQQEFELLKSKLKKEIETQRVSITRLRDASTKIKLNHDLMFAPGQTYISKKGTKILDQIAKVLKQFPDRKIEIIGHTDDIPVKSGTRQAYVLSNWELSAARAGAAIRYLQHANKIAPERMILVGASQYQPLVKGNNDEVRAKNRRIEIRILPPEAI